MTGFGERAVDSGRTAQANAIAELRLVIDLTANPRAGGPVRGKLALYGNPKQSAVDRRILASGT